MKYFANRQPNEKNTTSFNTSQFDHKDKSLPISPQNSRESDLWTKNIFLFSSFTSRRDSFSETNPTSSSLCSKYPPTLQLLIPPQLKIVPNKCSVPSCLSLLDLIWEQLNSGICSRLQRNSGRLLLFSDLKLKLFPQLWKTKIGSDKIRILFILF